MFRRRTSRIKDRLHPGRIFLVDTAQGRIIDDEEIKRQLAAERPYADWLARELVHIDDLPDAPAVTPPPRETVLRRQRAFGYTEEDLRILIAPMAQQGAEPIGSMGHGHVARGAVEPLAAALRLLQAALRAGHEPAASTRSARSW